MAASLVPHGDIRTGGFALLEPVVFKDFQVCGSLFVVRGSWFRVLGFWIIFLSSHLLTF
jgi:hypothetical protein